jgi:hypothetical protein
MSNFTYVYNNDPDLLTSPGKVIDIKNTKENVEGSACYWKHFAFLKNKGQCSTFVETGTYHGDGILSAFGVGFEKIYSIEILQENYDISYNRWKHKSNVKLHLGSTSEKLEEILAEIDSPSFFWLDAHIDNCGPTYKELEIINNHHIKNHTILIDDISIYFNKKHIETTIKNINPNYTIFYEASWRGVQEILVAKIF